MKWTQKQAEDLFNLPFNDIMYEAQTIHRKNFNHNTIQVSTLLSIKTGSCPEDCAYCSQSAHYKTHLKKEPLIKRDDVLDAAIIAKKAGATRFCMGAAWRTPHRLDLDRVCQMIKDVKNLGLETCATLGMLKDGQAEQLKEAGLDFYNHNIDTSPEFYEKIITTRTFQDRLDTLEKVRKSGIKICCGGILGLGETNYDRIKMILVLANLDVQPESVTINKLINIPGTPLSNVRDVDPFDFIKIIALARIMIQKAHVRLSAGREEMSDEMQALCFMAGANSIFYGEKLLTTENPDPLRDNLLFERLGLKKEKLFTTESYDPLEDNFLLEDFVLD